MCDFFFFPLNAFLFVSEILSSRIGGKAPRRCSGLQVASLFAVLWRVGGEEEVFSEQKATFLRLLSVFAEAQRLKLCKSTGY